jgi:hypothetical protein
MTRYYFKLRKPIDELCRERSKAMPTRDALSSLTNYCSFRKDEYSRIFDFGSHSFSDGMLEALSRWLDLEPHEFVALTLDAPDHVREGAFDSFRLGWEGIQKSIHDNREYIVHELSYLSTEDEVRDAVEEWQIELGYQLLQQKGGQPRREKEEMLEVTLKHLRLRAESELPSKVVSWWRVNPRICMSAFDLTHKRCGVSCLLPLSAEAYELVKSEKLKFHEIAPEQVQEKSSDAVLLGATDFSYRLNATYRRASTRSVIGCLLAQIVHALGGNAVGDLSLLGLMNTRLTQSRLESLGFQSLSTKTIGRSMPFGEIVSCAGSSHPLQNCSIIAARWIGAPRKKRSQQNL